MMQIAPSKYLISGSGNCHPQMARATATAATKLIPPMEGIKDLWIFLPPGVSPSFMRLRNLIRMGVTKNPTVNAVNMARIKNIMG